MKDLLPPEEDQPNSSLDLHRDQAHKDPALLQGRNSPGQTKGNLFNRHQRREENVTD
jgi:hypothetical protein